MASRAAFEQGLSTRRPVPIVATIDTTALPGGARRKAKSVVVGTDFCRLQDREIKPIPQAVHPCRSLAENILPRPLASPESLEFTARVIADFLVLLVSSFLMVNAGLLWRMVTDNDVTILDQTIQSYPRIFGWLTIYGALITLFLQAERSVDRNKNRAFQPGAIVLAKVIFWTTTVLSIPLHQSGTQEFSTQVLWMIAPLNLLGMIGWRSAAQAWRTRALSNGGAIRLLIVGAGALGRQVASALQQDKAARHEIVGFLDEWEPVGGDVLGRTSDLARISRAEFVDEIVLAFESQPELKWTAIRDARRSGLDVRIVPDYFSSDSRILEFELLNGVPLLTLHRKAVPRLGLYLKRAVDVVFSAFALLLAAPLFALIALLIKLDSPGPVFYRAPRVGRKGRSFVCYKFRTMARNADQWKERLRGCNEREGPFFKIANDPRITRVGRFLRRYSLDELPQLWNVLSGEMSLVGPRPHPLDDFKRYHLDHLRRLDVTPGLTGLWQVTARRDPSFQRNMVLDVEYIENWNFWMDLRILCRTVPAVLSGSGT